MVWQAIARDIEAATGRPFRITQTRGVGGGCINETQTISDGERRFFVKLNAADQYHMFAAEAEGLQELAKPEALRIPGVIASGVAGGRAYLVLEQLDLGGSGSAADLGERLAAQHRYVANNFGWQRDNTIGSTPQYNDWNPDWLDFFHRQRLAFQLDLAGRNGFAGVLTRRGERLLEALPALLDHRPEASLLHGDLWSGNYAFTRDGEAVIFDPAVYYGDREADLAMTELFGGFSREFYAAYNATWPLDEGYAVRKTLYNLYHILNHANLFGASYAQQAANMMDRLLAEV